MNDTAFFWNLKIQWLSEVNIRTNFTANELSSSNIVVNNLHTFKNKLFTIMLTNEILVIETNLTFIMIIS